MKSVNAPSVHKFRPQRNAKVIRFTSPVSTLCGCRGRIPRMNAEILQRLERIETQSAHLEHQVEQLNEVVVGQDRLVEHLKKQVQRMSGVLETMELERIKNNNPAPPHY
jgi:uncharacterized coiled-coil protein SlyX